MRAGIDAIDVLQGARQPDSGFTCALTTPIGRLASLERFRSVECVRRARRARESDKACPQCARCAKHDEALVEALASATGPLDHWTTGPRVPGLAWAPWLPRFPRQTTFAPCIGTMPPPRTVSPTHLSCVKTKVWNPKPGMPECIVSSLAGGHWTFSRSSLCNGWIYASAARGLVIYPSGLQDYTLLFGVHSSPRCNDV